MSDGEVDEEFEHWSPDRYLDPADLANALETIRRAAVIHWLGQAFEPRHMLGIADLATKALTGEAVSAPYDLQSVLRSERVKRMTELWEEDE